MLATFAMTLSVLITTFATATPYVLPGNSPPPGSPPSPAVYSCQDQCSQNCAPMCTPSCCGAKTDQAITANAYPPNTGAVAGNNAYATSRPNWNTDAAAAAHNTPPVARDANCVAAGNCAPAPSCAGKTPEMMIHSIEEGETEECNSDKGFSSPTDDSEDPPGTITIPLPDTLYTPPKMGEGPTELPLPAFHIPADILNGKFPKESQKLEPISAGSPNAVPVVAGGMAGATATTAQILETNVGQQMAAAVTPAAPAPAAAVVTPPAPPPPPPVAPSYPIYPKLPPITVSEIPKKKVPVAGLPVPYRPPAPLAPPAVLPLATNTPTPLLNKPCCVSLPNAAAPLRTPQVITPPAATKASVACEPNCPINIETGSPADDEKEYESMVKEMKSQFDARSPQVPKKRTRGVKSSRVFKKSKMSRHGRKARKSKSAAQSE